MGVKTRGNTGAEGKNEDFRGTQVGIVNWLHHKLKRENIHIYKQVNRQNYSWHPNGRITLSTAKSVEKI